MVQAAIPRCKSLREWRIFPVVVINNKRGRLIAAQRY